MTNQIESIKRILTNHPQSSLEGLLQLVGGEADDVRNAVDHLLEEGWLTTGVSEWNGTAWTVYKKKKSKSIKP